MALLASAPAAALALVSPARAASHSVSIKNSRFNPSDLTIKAGDTVTWSNADGMDHTATARDKSWTTKNLPGGSSDAVTFATKGTFKYVCRWHPGMKGTITVT
jgi:plastocyanin